MTSAFAVRSNGRFEGLVTGLSLGPNVLTARAPGAKDGRVTVTNHPNGGPVFSGPQVQPWVCQSTAVDAQCNQPPSYEYRYKTTGGAFADYDPDSPPSDVASTTTDQGKTVPYIVRVETGYQDRDQYKIAVLYDPTKPWTAWDPQDAVEPQAPDQSRRELRHRAPGGLGAGRRERRRALARLRGDVHRAQQRRPQLQHRHPGRVDGDGEGAAGRAVRRDPLHDRHRLLGRLAHPAAGGERVPRHLPGHPAGVQLPGRVVDRPAARRLPPRPPVRREPEPSGGRASPGTPASIAAVEGHPNHVNSIVFDTVYWTSLGVPDDGCPGVPAEQTPTTPQTNPGGVRCTLADYMINVFGPAAVERVEPRRAAGRATASPDCRSTTSACSTGSRR